MSFDPYYEWLGIPPKDQPPHHYRLLSLDLFEANDNVIQRAADRQMSHIRSYQNGPHGAASQKLLNELSSARLCLLDRERKEAYDAQLRAKLAPAPAPPPPPPPPPPPTARPAAPRTEARPAPATAQDTAVSLKGSVTTTAPPASPPPEKEDALSATLPLGLAIGGGILGGGLLLIVVLWFMSAPMRPAVAQNGKEKPGVSKPLDKPVKPVKPRSTPLPKPGQPTPGPNPADPVAPVPQPVPAAVDPMQPPPPAAPVVVPIALIGDIPDLVFYAPFDEGQGGSARDLAGSAAGKIVGNVKWTDGKFGKAVELDGSTRIDFGDILNFERDEAFSMCAWVRVRKPGVIMGRILPTDPFTGYEFSAWSDKAQVNLLKSVEPADWLEVRHAARLDDDVWRHMAVTYDGTTRAAGVTLYLDGAAKTGEVNHDDLRSSMRNASSFCLGARTVGHLWLEGSIDEARVYRRRLTAAEILKIYRSDPSDLESSVEATQSIPDLAFYAPLDEGRDAVAADAAAGVQGKIIGTPKWVEGKFGQALEFDGESHVDFGQILDFEADDPFTVSAWFWWEPGVTGNIVSKMSDQQGGPENSLGYNIDLYEGNFYANMIRDLGDNASLRARYTPPAQPGWVHAAWTYDGQRKDTGMKVYLAGKETPPEFSRRAVEGSIRNRYPFQIGARNGAIRFRGKIDEVRVYRRSLTVEEIMRIATSRPEDLIQAGRITKVALDPEGLPIEVVPLVDRKADAALGAWSGEKELLSTADDPRALLQLPVAPPLSYRLVVIGQRISPAGTLTLGLPVGRSAAAVTFFAPGGEVSLGNVAGAVQKTQLKAAVDPQQEFVLVCEASPHELLVRINGEEAARWQGEPSTLALPAAWRSKMRGVPLLGVEQGAFRITRVQLSRWTPPDRATAAARPAPPSEAAIKEFVANVKNDFRNQIRNAKTAEARIAVAEEMVSKSLATDEPRLNYALLTQARDMAAAAGGIESAFSAIDRLADRYAVDRWKEKAAAFADAGRAPAIPARQQQIVRMGVALAEEAAAAESYAAADDFLDIVLGLAAKLKDNDTRAAALARREEYRQAEKFRVEAEAAKVTLARNPTNGAAHEIVGRYRSLARGEWRAGLVGLQQGADERLAQAAAAERGAATPIDRKRAAQQWWRYAAGSNDPFKLVLQRHSLELLLESLAKLPAEEQRATMQTIEQMLTEVPVLMPRPARRGLKAWFKADEGVLAQNGGVYQWTDMSGSGNHARQDKPEFAMTVTPRAIHNRPAVHAEPGTGQCLTFPLPDIASYEGITLVFVGNLGKTGRPGTILGVRGPDLRWILGVARDGLGTVNALDVPLSTKGIDIERPFLVCHRFNRERWTTSLNGEVAGRAADRTFAASAHSLCIGSYVPNDVREYCFAGDIAEILVYDHPLSDQDHRALVLYLSLKYGLNLPPPAIEAK